MRNEAIDSLIWMTIALPFIGALILAIFGAYLPKKIAGVIGCASIGLAFVLGILPAMSYIANPQPVDTTLYNWINTSGLRVGLSLHLDALSIVMMFVVTFVGFLIHLYAAQSMYDEDSYSRFFAYMNLFVGSMLTLVLAGDMLLLYLGWEGVGLCSYLLIGFWYKDAANIRAAQKAFIVTRIGDTAFAIGLFLIYRHFGTFDISTISTTANTVLGASAATLIAFLLLGGAVGKSAQVPLQTWLPDAMAGPTPTSALIHAATMVTAGVYLIARMHSIYLMAPIAMLAVAIVGTITLFYSGFTALAQRDIKRVLAYSTISQIGYMFLALGMGAWAAAMFHFLTHAFFKALLFLSAGVVIDAQHHEHDMFKMGGLRRALPTAFWTFLIGASSLSALPLITAGFYSKDAIIWAAYSSPNGSAWFWGAGLAAALVTSIYSFRALFVTFYGEQKMPVTKRPGVPMKISLWILSFFAITAGFISLPGILVRFNPFGDFISRIFPAKAMHHGNIVAEIGLMFTSAIIAFAGISIAYAYAKYNLWERIAERPSVLIRFFFTGWGFDWLYNTIFVAPLKAVAFANRRDIIDQIYRALAGITKFTSDMISQTQTGRLRNYAAGLAAGAVIVIAIVLMR